MRKIYFTLMLAAFWLLAGSGCRTVTYVHVGPNWAALHDLKPSDNAFQVTVTGRDKLTLGEEISFTVYSAKPGNLWIVQVDPKDNLTVLFPNQRVRDNYIQAEATVRLPPQGADWSIVANEPLGPSVIAFIVVRGEADLNQALGQKDGMAKALSLASESPSWGLAKLIVEVKGKEEK
ncbi:MAG: DUF4384 domain-containing protein [Thermodesulfobacteriota bacterium]